VRGNEDEAATVGAMALSYERFPALRKKKKKIDRGGRGTLIIRI